MYRRKARPNPSGGGFGPWRPRSCWEAHQHRRKGKDPAAHRPQHPRLRARNPGERVNAQPSPLSLVTNEAAPSVAVERLEDLVVSYRRLADVFHDVLAEQSLDTLLHPVADTLAQLVPHHT